MLGFFNKRVLQTNTRLIPRSFDKVCVESSENTEHCHTSIIWNPHLIVRRGMVAEQGIFPKYLPPNLKASYSSSGWLIARLCSSASQVLLFGAFPRS